MTDKTEVRKGLVGVVADYTTVSKVDPDSNSLLYRGYPVQDLAEKCNFEEVAYLLWHGELPNNLELARFTSTERADRSLDPVVKAVMDSLPIQTHPMDVLRTAVSVLGARDPQAEDPSSEAVKAKAIRLFAATPAIIAYDQRRRHGQQPVEPRADLNYAQNFLWMAFGELPSEAAVRVFEISMVLYAEHSFNASAFSARVITSTLSDYHSAIVGGICALKGALHGGANEAVMHTFAEIGTADKVELWLQEALASSRKIMGFGHRVYKNGDSRVPTMKAALDVLIEDSGRSDLGELYAQLESIMSSTKNILPNLDFPSGPAYHILGFDTEMFTSIFAASRITGWTAHILEQAASNSLIRPLAAYNGSEERKLPR